ncbi:MAG: phosphotransferase [Nitrospiraceae bacterium]|nr:phosphotransferase [Nitrospiraceae bacterium]
MNRQLCCFIVAAGKGERLMPITAHIPKPLLPITGKPLLQTLLEKIFMLKPDAVGLNTHHLSAKVIEWINSSSLSERVRVFNEPILLDTGGALKNASSMLSHGIFLVHNGDIITDIDLQNIVEYHISSSNMATLAVHDCKQFNNVVISPEGSYVGIKGRFNAQNGSRCVAFTGIAVYNSEFLKYIPEGVSSVIDAWAAATADGQKIQTLDCTGCSWTDIGTPSSYAASVARELSASGETLFISSSSTGCEYTTINGLAAIEHRTVIEQGVSLENCIVLSDTFVKSGSYRNCILVQDKMVDLEQGCFSMPVAPDGVLIGSGGSDRRYYRITRENESKVLMICAADDPDFDRHIKYTEFFTKHKIPVPAFLGYGPKPWSAFFEDVGDTSLYSWMKCIRNEQAIEEMYKKVLDIAASIHSIDIAEAGVISRVFDYDHLIWETSYFLERFARDYCGIALDDEAALRKEFAALAEKADSFRKTVIHRDFQSQNIMIKDNEPRVIDFQGARIGPSGYDIASMLWDPYVQLTDALRSRLLEYYLSIRKAADSSFDADEFNESLIFCRLQRHMQALGAYAFLSEVQGKKYFQKHMPACLKMLHEESMSVRFQYPGLFELVSEIMKKFKSKAGNCQLEG